jgi:hypothetical protein
MAVSAPTSVGAAYTTLSNTTSAFTTTATAPSGSLMIMGAGGWNASGTGSQLIAGTMTTVTVDLAVGIMFADFTGGSTSTAGTNYTELFDVANATNNQTFTMVYRVNAPTGSNTPVNTWGAAVTTWLGVSVAIAPVAAVTGPSTSTPAFNAIPFMEGLNL